MFIKLDPSRFYKVVLDYFKLQKSIVGVVPQPALLTNVPHYRKELLKNKNLWFRASEHSKRFDHSFEYIFHLTSHYKTSQTIARIPERANSGSNSGNLRGKRYRQCWALTPYFQQS